MKKAAVLIMSFMLVASAFVLMLDVNVEGKDILPPDEILAEVTPAPLFAGGDGSIGDPFQIADIYELQDMSTDLTAHYILINDIDASETSAPSWIHTPDGLDPIGDSGTPFTGSLDGQNFIIIDLFIDSFIVPPINVIIAFFSFFTGYVDFQDI